MAKTYFVVILILISVVKFSMQENATTQSEVTTIDIEHETTTAIAITTSKAAKKKQKYTCPYVPGATIENDKARKICCDHIVKRFNAGWYVGGKYLTTHLAILKSWKCPQFDNQCKLRTFAFNDFTKYVYMRECEPQKLYQECLPKLNELTENQKPSARIALPINDVISKNSSALSEEWKTVAKSLQPTELEFNNLLEPCVQIAMYDHDEYGYGRYHEVVNPFVPFCGFMWCGFNKDSLDAHKVSTWKCMPSRCQINLIIAMVVIGVLGLITLLGNLTIILVFIKNRHLVNSQAFYKCTLAFGDLLVGGVVFPTFISTFYFLYISPHSLGDEIRSERNGTLPVHAPGGKNAEFFQAGYLRTLGFFTTFSLFVSVYSLMGASIDRLVAIMRPLTYDRSRSQVFACIGCTIICVCGGIFAIVPFFVRRMEYTLVASILVASSGRRALILYIIAFAVPLVIVWVTTIATLCYVISNTRLRGSTSSSKSRFEIRLFKTLAIMVGVFTAVILPAVFTMLIPFGLDNVFVHRPFQLEQHPSNVLTSIEFVSTIILTSNSLWNIFIYSTRHKDFRKAAVDIHLSFFNTITRRSSWGDRFDSKSVSRTRKSARATSASSVAQVEMESLSTNTTYCSNGGKTRTSISSPVEENGRKFSEFGVSVDDIPEIPVFDSSS